MAGDRADRAAGRVDLPHASARADRLREDDVERFGEDVLAALEYRAPAREAEAAGELVGMAPEHDHVADRQKVRKVPDHDPSVPPAVGTAERGPQANEVDLESPPRPSPGARALREFGDLDGVGRPL